MSFGRAGAVRAFCEAIRRKDTAALRAVIGERFATDAVMVWPESLPHGGTVVGADKLAKVSGGLASPSAPMGLAGLELVDVVDGGDRLAARVEFDWCVLVNGFKESIAISALQLWTFDGYPVREARAYNWDAAALSRLSQKVSA